MNFSARRTCGAALVALVGACLLSSSASVQAVSTVTPPLSIAVAGNHLVDGSGDPVTLHGVDISGTEYNCLVGGVFSNPANDAGIEAMVSWHINAVRIPLNEDCWLGINGVGGASYRNAIVAYVDALNSLGLYAILDLHYGAPGTTKTTGEYMADADHSPSFWKSVATVFLPNHAVLFDLFNEPHDIPWSTWLNGGTVPAMGRLPQYTAAGMQQLVDAVRSTGATQPVLVEGTDFGTKGGTSWLSYAPDDPAGQMVASVHVYGQASTSVYQSNIGPIKARFPVIVGELGEYDCADEDIDSFMPWAVQNGVSYLAWAWYVGSCSAYPSLLVNYEGAPTAYGAGYESYLRAHFPAPIPPGTVITPTGARNSAAHAATHRSTSARGNRLLTAKDLRSIAKEAVTSISAIVTGITGHV